MEKKLQLFGRRVHPLAVHQQLVGVQVDDQLVEGEALFAAALLLHAEAAQHRVDAGKDLLHLKGLNDVVVRAPLQTVDLVLGLALGGEHDDGGFVGLADLLQYRPAVHHGQHDVQQHQVRAEGAEEFHALAPVGSHCGFKALLLQIEMQKLRDVGLVLHDKHFSRHMTPSLLS